MANKMLIDASHPEETRVVVVRGQKVEEFDFESASRRQLRGNIYLAKVTRVEPSLQAAFVEYGGNRHGFLAFSEIHPDYYQIPVADRQALLEEDARAERDEEREDERRRSRRPRHASKQRRSSSEESVSGEAETSAGDDEGSAHELEGGAGTDANDTGAAATESPDRTAAESIWAHPEESRSEAAPEHSSGGEPSATDEVSPAAVENRGEDAATERGGEAPHELTVLADAPSTQAELADPGEQPADHEDEAEPVIEQVGGRGDALEEIPERRRPHRRQYKIQEVIKRRQILLVQVVKEERGTKGAALTTYLSLAGRYSVLMPNTGRGGGISRKITSAADRKRLKEIAEDLEVPEGMGVILRTAGASRTRAEIKRDFEYLMRLWESVRELTLTSSAPALVYEEGSLIKRAIRDLYNKDIDEVIVAGDEAYREAKDFMRMLMPSHAKAVKPYKDPQPLFARYGVEAQLDAMFSNHVTLKSGGYLVINPTEALVSIDVNSGRSTREHNIEDTALRTNLEAAEEIARQLRLRDLAGLIVIDFIDMEEKRNNRSVEKKLNECLKNDRARIQVGRISPFGLLEMSRQRIRTGVLESSSIPCPHCGGAGHVRATPSVALHILRSVEESLIKSAAYNLCVRTKSQVAFYILNQKRTHLRELEERFGVVVSIMADEHLAGPTVFVVDRMEPVIRTEPVRPPAPTIQIDAVAIEEPADEVDDVEAEPEAARGGGEPAEQDGESNGEGGRRRRRRRRRRGRGEGRSEEGRGDTLQGSDAAEGEDTDETDEEEDEALETASSEPRGERPEGERSGERGGRRGRRPRRWRERDDRRPDDRRPAPQDGLSPAVSMAAEAEEAAEPEHAPEAGVAAAQDVQVGPGNGADVSPATSGEPAGAEALPRAEPEPEPVAVVLTPPDPDRPKRAGWWSRAKAALGGS
jgi:ribonuclease E